MTHNDLTTLWTQKGQIKKAACKYPRPQLVRGSWELLNGYYDYAITNEFDTLPPTFDGKILVPFAVETELSGVKRKLMPGEYLHYRRFFDAAKKSGYRLILNFEAVDWHSKIYINGKFVKENIGGYLPFSIDITDCIKEGQNELRLAAYDPTDSEIIQRGKQTAQPKGIWYTSTSGIWQTVWLEWVPEDYIKDIEITPDLDSQSVIIEVCSEFEGEALVEIVSDGICVAKSRGITNKEMRIKLENAKLWSPDSPFLYDIKATLLSEGIRDTAESYFGMRKIEVKKDSGGYPRTYLNNEPVFLHGVLDQGYWPESGMTAPCDEALAFDILKMKELGFNMIRKHVKIECRRWYHHADTIGIMVFQDMVSGGNQLIADDELGIVFADNSAVRDDTRKAYNKAGRSDSSVRMFFEREIMDMLLHLHSVPSIAAWVPFNEGWGQYNSEDIAFGVKRKDPTRLIDAASGWVDMGAGDFNSVHTYIAKLKEPKEDKRAYFISEYGGYNLPTKGHLWSDTEKYGYLYYESKKELTEAYRALIETQLIPLVKKGLTAAVYTQLSDVETETNGIYTYDRKVMKFEEDILKEINRGIYAAFSEAVGRE